MSNPFDIPMSAELADGYGRDFSVSAAAGDEERVVESALRPHSLGDFIG
jgi:Holliday junction DNA helicase RuvB